MTQRTATHPACLALGVVAVMSFYPAPAWAENTYTVIDLGDLPGGIDWSAAYGINNEGQICGGGNADTGQRALYWDNGVMTDLGVEPGAVNSWSRDINAVGEVVGDSPALTVDHRPVLWSGGVITNLGKPLGDEGFGRANGINDQGQVVGFVSATQSGRAFR